MNEQRPNQPERRDERTSFSGDRLARLLMVVPLSLLAFFFSAYGAMVFVSGFTREYYDSDPAMYLLFGGFMIVVGVLLAGVAYLIATNGRHRGGWLAITVGAVSVAVVPFLLLVAGALRGGSSLLDALTRNARHYLDLAGWRVGFGRFVILTVVALAVVSALAYLFARRPGLWKAIRRLPPLVVALIVVALTGAAGLFVFYTVNDASRDATPVSQRGDQPEPIPTVSIDPSGVTLQRPEIPAFTEAHREATIAVALGSEAVQDLLEGREARPVEVGLWHSGPDLIGGVVMLDLDQPVAIDGRWARVRWIGEGDSYYETAPYRAEYENVTDLLVHVDLRHGIVAGVEPGPVSGAQAAGPIEWTRITVQRVLLSFLSPRGITIVMLLTATGVLGAIAWVGRRSAYSPGEWLAATVVSSLGFFLVFLQTGGTIAPSLGYPMQVLFGILATGSAAIYVLGARMDSIRPSG